MLAVPLWVQCTGFFRLIRDYSLGFLDAAFHPFLEPTTCRSTEFYWNLYTLGYWAEFGLLCFAQTADFFWPLGAGCGRGVPRSVLFAFFFLLGLAFWNIVFNLMFLLRCSTFTFILCRADFFSFLITVLNKRCSAHIHRHIGSSLAVLNETLLHKVLAALLFLCRAVDGDL